MTSEPGSKPHATTLLALEPVEEVLKIGSYYFDIGCGEGVLIKAAGDAGAEAWGFDIDPIKIEKARDLTRDMLNVVVTLGSITRIKEMAEAIPDGVDLVTVNFYSGAAIEYFLENGLVEIVKPGGLLVLTGFEVGDEPSIKAAYPLKLVKERVIKGKDDQGVETLEWFAYWFEVQPSE